MKTIEVTKEEERKIPVSVLKAQLANDWSNISEDDRLKACLAICKVLNIPTPLNPFKFIPMRGKTVLYAPAEAAQLLAERNKISLTITNKYIEQDSNIYMVEVRAETNGRVLDNMACLYIGGLTGEARANAYMKTITKAMRRTVFAAVGLSVLDEEEDNAQPSVAAKIIEKPIDQETEDLKATLFEQLVGKAGLFSDDPVSANRWIMDQIGKKFNDLHAADVEELLSRVQPRDLDEELPPPQEEMFP